MAEKSKKIYLKNRKGNFLNLGVVFYSVMLFPIKEGSDFDFDFDWYYWDDVLLFVLPLLAMSPIIVFIGMFATHIDGNADFTFVQMFIPFDVYGGALLIYTVFYKGG